MRTLLIIMAICMLGFHPKSNAKTIVQGQVIDSATNLPIEYASIFLEEEQSIGTITNEDGFFILKIPSDQVATNLLVTHLSYELKKIVVFKQDTTVEIQLTPAIITLQTLEVTQQGYAAELVENAYNKAIAEEPISFQGKGFYSQRSMLNDTCFEVLEAITDISFSNKAIYEWKVAEGRYAKNPESIFRFTNFSALTRVAPTFKKKLQKLVIPLSAERNNYYDFFLKERIYKKEGDQSIAVINFSKQTKVDQPILEGQIYIDENTFNIIRIVGKATDLEVMNFPKKIQMNAPIYYFDINYKEHTDKMILERINVKASYLLSSKKRPSLNGQLNIESVFICYEVDQKINYKLTKNKNSLKMDDLKVIRKANYDPLFWKENEIIRHNTVDKTIIQDLENQNFFESSPE